MERKRYSIDELNNCSRQELIIMVMSMQDQLDRMNENLENLIEQIRIANLNRFGRKTERMDQIDGQLSLFNEAEYLSEESWEEPAADEILPAKKPKRKKGQRDEDLKGFPEEFYDHRLTDEELDLRFGEGCWRRLPSETYKRLRYEPASWTVEVHTVDVAVGTDGLAQDEFARGSRPKDLLRNSILTNTLAAAVFNGKFTNAIPLNRIEQEFQRNGLRISRQTMANWVIQLSERYLSVIYERLKTELLSCHVNQADETPVKVIHDGRPAGSTSYMWVHRSGEFYKDHPVVLYEYQKTRHHDHPREFYKGFNGVLMTDGLQQYHMLEDLLPGVTSANCFAHARRDFADAVKAMGTKDEKAVHESVAYQALARIAVIYKLEGELRNMSPEERLRERQRTIKPVVEDYFTWVKARLADHSVLPKSKTAQGLRYSVNQEKYLKVFLEDGEVPIDNSASERSIRPFTVGRKAWVLINSVKGAEASAVAYSITETAKLNNLNPYYYYCHLFSELAKLSNDKGYIDTDALEPTALDDLLPWSTKLPKECYKGRR